MSHEKDRRVGRTYVEPGELSARERARETRRRHRPDAVSGADPAPGSRGHRARPATPDAADATTLE